MTALCHRRLKVKNSERYDSFKTDCLKLKIKIENEDKYEFIKM